MWVDAHAHVDRFELLDEGALPAALAEMAGQGILTLSNSMDLPSYRRNLEIARSCEWVIPAFGVHPWNAPEVADRLHELDEAIESCPVIGEVGLDHYFVEDAAAYPDQRRVLEFLLQAARAQDKIVCLHTKGAEREVLELVNRSGVQRAIVHWYSGPLDVLQEWVARGAHFTVGVEVLYSDHIQTLARQIPLDRLLTETDNPGGPMGVLGRPGTPGLIQDVVRGIAEARGTSVQAINQAVRANLLALVRGDSWLAGRLVRLLAQEDGRA